MQSCKAYFHLAHSQRKEAQSPGKLGPEQEENKDMFKSNHLIFAEHQHRPTLEDQRRTPDNVGLKVAQQGCRRTHVGLAQAQPC